MRGSKPSVNKSKKERQADVTFVKVGSSRGMVKPQAAGPATPARTGKVQSPAPGGAAAQGGKGPQQAVEEGKSVARSHPAVGGLARPARAGQTGA
jgi:hypothetical protein